jgi:NTE family protein
MNNIENLVFEGGGVRGIAYAGAIEVLEAKNILQSVKRVAGTSAGAITAALVSLNYDAATITKVVRATDFKGFEDHWNPLRIPIHYGLYEGDFLLGFIQSFIEKKIGNKNATFEDLKNLGCKDLRVFSSDLNMQQAREFSYEKTPKTIVAEAVRASMSIPLFFKAWSFTNNIPDNHIYVDGGLTYNYPITAFDQEEANMQTLGFHFGDLGRPATNNNLEYDHLLGYVKAVFGMLLDTQKIDFERDSTDKERTVNVDDLGISATDFNLTEEQKTNLYNSGKHATTAFFDNLIDDA